jgi:hypothetical protein
MVTESNRRLILAGIAGEWLERRSVQPLSESLGVLLPGRPGDHALARVRQTYAVVDHLSSESFAQ